MKGYEDKQLQNVEEQEVYVTNAAIKCTDLLWAVGVGAFALTGVVSLLNARKKDKQLREKQDFKARVIAEMIASGESEEKIENCKKLLNKIV